MSSSYFKVRGKKRCLNLPFIFADGGSNAGTIRYSVRKALASSGMDSSKYCGHSFRIGAATTAAEQGIKIRLSVLWGMAELSLSIDIRTPRDAICAVAKH